MLFNSIDFAIFLPLVFAAYWLLRGKLKSQNFLIVFASYVFYGWWDWRFLSLILFSTVVDYFVGIRLEIASSKRNRIILLMLSLSTNLGLLGFFKYYNFFLDNFISAFSLFGTPIEGSSLSIVLPVGISFYTFQTLSYTIDVFRNNLRPTRDFISFAAFVSFFPQLVAGPIERATHLLPQFYSKRVFDYNRAVDGMRQILWGLFKKVVIADNCAYYVNMIYNNSDDYSGSTLLLGTILFAFQIYGDFSGYSDIAIGTARLFGFDLMKNFAFPYFSRDIAEFWRRWHISLSTWFRDYVYIPLGGSRKGKYYGLRNIIIVFVVSGFWHGANWTFIFWGLINALFFIPLFVFDLNRKNTNDIKPGFHGLHSLQTFANIVLTFFLVNMAWVFFRSENIIHAFQIFSSIFSESLLSIPQVRPWPLIVLIIGFIGMEWLGKYNEFAIEKLVLKWVKPLRWSFYLVLALMIIVFNTEQQEFIYFQF